VSADERRKLVVFVPADALDRVRDALFDAGAGRIGDYERCSFYTEGTGTFLPLEGSNPTVGEPGREERVAELRLETVYPAAREAEVVQALREAHPYEEPAFDLYPLLAAPTAPSVTRARLSTDGGARGNPGPAAYGYVLEAEDGTVLAAHGETIGVATNNVAEYRALLAGLEKAADVGVRELTVVSDSELLVRQMTGQYKVKNETLRDLSSQAGRLARRFDRVEYKAVRREHNELADRLVNEALDAAADP
jgi:ribonuclease HI